MEAVRAALVVFVCAVLAGVAGQQQTDADNQVSGFLFELLLTHLSAFEGRIQEQLNELGRNQIRQTELLQRILDGHGSVSGQTDRPSALQNQNRSERSSRCALLNIQCRLATINHLPHERLHGEWIVVQTRFDGSLTFQQNWPEYRDGFGDLWGEHWLGLQKLHQLQEDQRTELLVLLETFDNETAYATYDDFRIGNESEQFALKSLGSYSGTAGDSLKYHLGSKFSTQDQDNDTHMSNCASMYYGGWWYKDCFACNLNGKYVQKDQYAEKGLIWNSFKGPFVSMKMSKMLIRPYSSN